MSSWSTAFVGGGGDDGEPGAAGGAEFWQRRHQPPDNEIPVALAVAEVLGRGDGIVVALTAVRAYSTGLQFDLALRLRTSTTRESNAVYDLFMGSHVPGREPTDRFLIGLEFADGRSVSNVDDWSDGRIAQSAGKDSSTASPTMMGGGGGGGGRRFDQTYWVSPLPPPGPLRFVCTWQARGIAETYVLLDGQAIAEAGSRAEQLWPWEPLQFDDDGRAEAVSAELPPGWFADRVRSSG